MLPLKTTWYVIHTSVWCDINSHSDDASDISSFSFSGRTCHVGTHKFHCWNYSPDAKRYPLVPDVLQTMSYRRIMGDTVLFSLRSKWDVLKCSTSTVCSPRRTACGQFPGWNEKPFIRLDDRPWSRHWGCKGGVILTSRFLSFSMTTFLQVHITSKSALLSLIRFHLTARCGFQDVYFFFSILLYRWKKSRSKSYSWED